MAFLGESPSTSVTASDPFAAKPTAVDHAVNEVQRAFYNGIGVAVGMTVAGYILFNVLRVRRIG